jgi:hypothetical protein
MFPIWHYVGVTPTTNEGHNDMTNSANIYPFPDGLQFFSIIDVDGVACIFTHSNAQGLGFLTYTGLAYAMENSVLVTLDGATRRLTRKDKAAILKHPAAEAFYCAREGAAKDFWAMVGA